jgi:hypothetical protein
MIRVNVSYHMVARQIVRTAGIKTSDRHGEGIAKNGVCGHQLVSDSTCQRR